MANKEIKNSLNAGELSPRLDARTDLSKYYGGESTLSNAIPLLRGGVVKRPGGFWIAIAKGPCRLLPFTFSTDDAMIIEFGNGYARFFKNEDRVMRGPKTITGITLEEPIPKVYTMIWHEVQPAGDTNWQWRVASDSDGSNLIAAQSKSNGILFTSSDYGETWVNRTTFGGLPKKSWSSVDSDSDGSHLIACCRDNMPIGGSSSYVYVSTNYGVTWTLVRSATLAEGYYTVVASDADGSNVIVGKDTFITSPAAISLLYTSNNYGLSSWVARDPTGYVGNVPWTSVASDDDGSHLVAQIMDKTYTSSDYGGIWIERFPTGSDPGFPVAETVDKDKHGIKTSSDGSFIIAYVGGYVYSSDDGGVTWTQIVYSNRVWRVTSDSDGSNLLVGNNDVFQSEARYSYNNGSLIVTLPTGSPNSLAWVSLASSSDGGRVIIGGTQRVYIGVLTEVV